MIRWIAVFFLVIQVRTAVSQTTDYPTAYSACDVTPMVVYIGAEWCPACVTAKSQVFNPMLECGEFSGFNVVFLDSADKYAQKILTGNKLTTIPQCFVFAKSKGWRCNSPIERPKLRKILEQARSVYRANK